jgi:hypothetical protein
MIFKLVFGMMDKMGPFGFMMMWLSFFFTTFGVLLADNTVGAPRNFCYVSQLVCCSNLAAVAYSLTHDFNFTKASMLTGPFDMFATLVSFAYFGGSATLGSSPIGVFNWIQIIMTVMMTIQMTVGLFAMALYPEGMRKHFGEDKNNNIN